jgi:hypothetical protein
MGEVQFDSILTNRARIKLVLHRNRNERFLRIFPLQWVRINEGNGAHFGSIFSLKKNALEKGEETL